MISIVICSRTSEISAELRQNIEETIGLEYELVVIDNSGNGYSIFSAYNEGVRRSKGDILCFMHEDILFKSQGWGKVVNRIFQQEGIGLVGIAGTHFLPSTPTYWTDTPFVTTTNQNNINGVSVDDFNKEYFNGQKLVDAVVCDGQWFCIPKNMFGSIRFDEDTFCGFHMYDMDICLQILNVGFRVCIIDDVLIEHWSLGNFDDVFQEELRKLYKKWTDVFPLSRGVDFVSRHTMLIIDGKFTAYSDLLGKYQSLIHSKNYRVGYRVLLPLRKIKKFFSHVKKRIV